MRGLLYSIMAALIIVPIFGIIFFHSQIGQKNIDISIRAHELKYFVDSIETDLQRFMEIVGKRALISAVSNITISGTPLDDAQLRLRELIENGTLKGNYSPLVDKDNLKRWEKNVSDIASNSGFDLSLKITETNVTQNSSFNILFEIKVLVNISDENAKMGILRNITAKSIVSIDGIEDPLFPLNTLGRVFKVIRYYNFSDYSKNLVGGSNSSGSNSGYAFVKLNADLQAVDINSSRVLVTDTIVGKEAIASSFAGVVSEGDTAIPETFTGQAIISGATNAVTIIENETRIYLDAQTKKVWDLQNLTLAMRNGYYKPSIDGASFLDRLEGRLKLSGKYNYGLESFVYLPAISDADIVVYYNLSCVDYMYWNMTGGSSIRNGDYDPVFDWFKIDSNHETIYGVNEL
ncbi:MAG: hypothetical protein GTN36_04015 [Candidatus Aenigmarchaeota archaeon]|nr:hypothetical protein [Candidatus Aenigmarchaeota archaeon]